jgi:hypothetical protein
MADPDEHDGEIKAVNPTGASGEQAGGKGFGILSVVFGAGQEPGEGGSADRDAYGSFRQGGGPRVGDPVGGFGVVADVTDRTFTVRFPTGAPKGPPDVSWTCTLVLTEHPPVGASREGPHHSAGPAVGDLVSGDGVVVDVTDSTFTVEFPDGAPEGPIDVPWTKDTVVIKGAPRIGKGDRSDERGADGGEPESYLYSDFRGANLVTGTPTVTGVDDAVVRGYVDDALR